MDEEWKDGSTTYGPHGQQPANDFGLYAPAHPHSPQGSGDGVLITTGDGSQLFTSRLGLEQVSPAMAKLVQGAVALRDRSDIRPLALYLPEDMETVQSILRAAHPDPAARAFHAIKTLDVAEKVIAAAMKYSVNTKRINLSKELFTVPKVAQDPFRYCVVAWNTQQWDIFNEVAKHTHQLDLSSLLGRSLQMIGGSSVLSALGVTRDSRNGQIDRIVGLIPMRIMCNTCLEQCRNPMEDFKEYLNSILNRPGAVPEVSVFDLDGWAHSIVAVKCRSENLTCKQSMTLYVFTDEEIDDIIKAIRGLHAGVNPLYLGDEFRQFMDMRWNRWSSSDLQ